MDVPPSAIPLLQHCTIPGCLLWPQRLALLPFPRLPPFIDDLSPLCHRRSISISFLVRIFLRALEPLRSGLNRQASTCPNLSFGPINSILHLTQGGPLHLPSPPPAPPPCRSSHHQLLLPVLLCLPPESRPKTPSPPSTYPPRQPHHSILGNNIAPTRPALRPHLPPHPIHNSPPLPTAAQLPATPGPLHYDRRLPHPVPLHPVALPPRPPGHQRLGPKLRTAPAPRARQSARQLSRRSRPILHQPVRLARPGIRPPPTRSPIAFPPRTRPSPSPSRRTPRAHGPREVEQELQDLARIPRLLRRAGTGSCPRAAR